MSALFEKVLAKALDKRSYRDGEVIRHTPIWDVVDRAQDIFERELLGKTFRTKDGKNVAFTKRGMKELFYSITGAMSGGSGAAINVFKQRDDDEDYMYDVLSIVPVLDDVIADMDFSYYEPNKKRDKKPDVRKYDTYECDVVVDGEEREAKVRVEVPFNGPDRFYFHYLDESLERRPIVVDGFKLL